MYAVVVDFDSALNRAVGGGAAGAARAAQLFELRRLIIIQIKLAPP